MLNKHGYQGSAANSHALAARLHTRFQATALFSYAEAHIKIKIRYQSFTMICVFNLKKKQETKHLWSISYACRETACLARGM